MLLHLRFCVLFFFLFGGFDLVVDLDGIYPLHSGEFFWEAAMGDISVLDLQVFAALEGEGGEACVKRRLSYPMGSFLG